MTSQYPKDEFDLAGDDMPVGMHRPEPSRWRNVFPFLVVLLAVPVLAWSFSSLLTSNTTAAQSGSNAAASAGSAQSAPVVEEPADSETPVAPNADEVVQSEPAPEQPAEPQPAPVNFNVAVEVLNGTDIQGLAAEKVAALNDAGFPGVTAANAQGWATQTSTVYYQDSQVESSAKEIARVLGIETVAVEPDMGGNADIVVVLK